MSFKPAASWPSANRLIISKGLSIKFQSATLLAAKRQPTHSPGQVSAANAALGNGQKSIGSPEGATERATMPLTIEINTAHSRHTVDRARLKKAVRLILRDAGIRSAEISIAVVTDERMHALNRQYLQHDYPTDVLSFVLAQDERARSLDGEIIVSSDYAAREALRYRWTTDDELLLYIIHGCLHLIGHDDTTAKGKAAMRIA